MPQVFAYLRVSTDAQDVANQKHGVVRYCIDKKLLEPVFVEDTVSGKTDWRDRQLGKMIRGAGQGEGADSTRSRQHLPAGLAKG